jgi:hypothetical protein
MASSVPLRYLKLRFGLAKRALSRRISIPTAQHVLEKNKTEMAVFAFSVVEIALTRLI